MDFRDFAANETSALIARILASQSEPSVHQLRTVRDALDAAARAMEAASNPTPQITEQVQELVKRLNAAAGAAVRIAGQRIRDEGRIALDAMREELESVRADNEKLAASCAEAEAHLKVLEPELRNERDRADSAERDLAAAREGTEQLEAARLETEASYQEQVQARADIEDELRSARDDLEAARDDAARLSGHLELETGQNATLKGELTAVEDELQRTREHLYVARDEAAALSGQFEAEAAENARLKAELESARDAQEPLEAAVAAAETAVREAAQARTAAEDELQDVRAALDAGLEEAAGLGVQLEASAAENGKLLAELGGVQGELHTVQAQREALAAQLKASAARVHTLERSQAKHDENIRQLEARFDAALQAEAKLREQAATDEAEASRARAEIVALRGEVDRLVSLLDASARGLDELAEATTLGDLLVALVGQLSNQFSRVALFRVKGNHLEGDHQFGFDVTTDIKKLVIPLSVDSLLTRAVASRSAESLTDTDLADGAGAPFGGTPAAAFALPLIFQDEALAVVYADVTSQRASDDGRTSYGSSAAFAALVVRQAAVLLMRLTDELKKLTELRDYATMLLQEVEQMHAADGEAGKTADELQHRLKDNLEWARQLYAQRAALEGSAAASLLDEEIAATIEGRAETAFARDLAAIVGHTAARRTAEAS